MIKGQSMSRVFVKAGRCTHHRIWQRWIAVLLLLLIPLASSASQNNTEGSREALLLRCVDRCDAVDEQVRALGGVVSVRYRNVNALAVQVPDGRVERVAALAGIETVVKDRLITLPVPMGPSAILASDIHRQTSLSFTDLAEILRHNPANYSFNNRLTGATVLHRAGYLGEGVIVGVIDSGVANAPTSVVALAGNVIGGESFVPGMAEPSATSTANDPHGTMVASIIAAHAALTVSNTSAIAQSLREHAPDSLLPLDADTSLIPMLGTAPAASLYALKVFPADGGGARASAVLAAMDRALSLKRNFNAGQPVIPVAGSGSEDDPFVFDALNIQVVNLSLGGPTLIPGLELEDVLVREMLANGITVVAAVGNEGPATLTGGSPGTSVAALAVGAANTAAHERIWLDNLVGPGFGRLYRANDAVQVADFSSRGPTADGRRGVDLLANGVGSFVQAADGGLFMVAGSSFSAPTVAGAAALLHQAQPSASASAVRHALMDAANDDLLEDTAGRVDQGKGFLDVEEALEELREDGGENTLPMLPVLPREPKSIGKSLKKQHLKLVDLEEGEVYSRTLSLLPGEVKHLLVPADAHTAAIHVGVSDITPALPAEAQNSLFGDDVLLTVVDAPTSYNEVLASEFVTADGQWVFANPQHGFVRLAVMGDFTNAGRVSARISLSTEQQKPLRAQRKQEIHDAQLDTYALQVPAGVSDIHIELDWKGDWGHYPVNDLDLILIDPAGNLLFDGATLRVPEQVSLSNPQPGVWTVIVDGFELHGTRDQYVLRALDGTGTPLTVLP